MNESIVIGKEADAKKSFSPARRNEKSIQLVRDESARQLDSLGSVIGNIRRDGAAPSAESIATELGSRSTGERAPALLALQKTHGNRYVQRVVAGIQAKLTVGQPGDIYEQEADRVADTVMRMPEPAVQRQPEEEEEEELQAKELPGQTSEVTPNLESHINAIRGGGQPLSESTRAFFEPRFGYDFSQVQVHTGTDADTLNHALNARAFTRGHDVVFGAGQYAPGTTAGRRLLAHELTHVVQQGKNYSARKYQPIRSSADSLDESVTAGDSMVSPSLVGCMIQREEEGAAPAASLSGLRAARTAFNNAGAPNVDNCATSQPASLGVGIGGNAQNAMEIIYRISGTIPAGTEFDITRTVTDTSWERDAANAWTRILHTPAGTKDDYHDADECLTPNARRIFVTDSPGFNGLNPRGMNIGGGVSVSGSATAFAIKLRFAEWVIARNRRLGIGWTRISQPCFTFWHSITSVALAGGTWSLANTPSGDSNEIELGSISTAGATP